LGAAGGLVVLVALLAAVFADVVAPYGYNEQLYAALLEPPGAAHLMGTDHLGRDLLSRLIFGARITTYVVFGAVTIGVIYALTIGLLTAWFGGALDLLVNRLIDAWMSVPFFLLILVLSSILGPSLLNVILVLSLFGITESRVVRGQALSVKQHLYIDAARATGARVGHILLFHMLPNILAPVIILATLRAGTVILAEASLSFLGYGIPPPFPSWGRMLGADSRLYLLQAPWLAIFPGLVLTLTVWGFNIFGDAIRDLLDPRLRGGGGRYR